MASRKVLSVFRTLIREAHRFDDYNFRHYAVRRIRAGFRENKALAGAEAEAALTDASGPQLEQLRRMTLVNGLFGSEKSVMENIDHHY